MKFLKCALQSGTCSGSGHALRFTSHEDQRVSR